MLVSNPDYYRSARVEMTPFVPARRTRVLEIGCGAGVFCSALPNVDERWGVEPGEAATEAAHRLDHVIRGTFNDAAGSLPRHYFDVVIRNDVIEHMPDHDMFLRRIRDHIAPGGVLVGSIPNVRYHENLFDLLLGRDWEYRESGILDRTHLRFFTERSLRRTFSRHGYAIEMFQGINGGFRLGRSDVLTRYKLFGIAALVLSAGFFSDIRYPQFGFRVRPI